MSEYDFDIRYFLRTDTYDKTSLTILYTGMCSSEQKSTFFLSFSKKITLYGKMLMSNVISFSNISCQKKVWRKLLAVVWAKNLFQFHKSHLMLIGLFYHVLSLCTHFLRHFFIPANFTIVTVHYSSKIEDASTGPWVWGQPRATSKRPQKMLEDLSRPCFYVADRC